MLKNSKLIFLSSVALLTALISNPAFAIINGNSVDPNTDMLAQNIVALQMRYKDETGTYVYKKGSAVIISENILLTAGHNLFYIQKASDIEAIFSATPCWGKNTCGETRIVGLEKVVHPDFINPYPNPPEYDIALLKLGRAIPTPYSEAVIATEPASLIGLSGNIYGHGMSIDEMLPAPLNDFRLRTTSSKFISFELGKDQKIWSDQKMSAFCAGDSGGPIFLSYKNIPTIVGITIHHAKANNGTPTCLIDGAFTDVVYFRNWILQTIRHLH